MDFSSSASDEALAPRPFPVPFAVVMALVILTISLLYALLFSNLVYISLMEQHFSPRYERLRFEGTIHFHSPAEWFLLAMPAVLGWLGTIGSLSFLIRRWRQS